MCVALSIYSQYISNSRHPPHIRSQAVTLPAGLHLTGKRESQWDQLAHAAHGVLRVETGGGMWIVPPHRAVWIPANIEHSLWVDAQLRLRSLYFRRGVVTEAAMSATVGAVNVSALLRELILEACRRNVLYRTDAIDNAMIDLLVDQLRLTTRVPLMLPTPKDARAVRAAETVLATLSSRASLSSRGLIAAGCAAAGASRRTVERLFLVDTAMSLGSWVRRAQLIRAIELLALSRSVAEIAEAVGYRTTSAFIHAFKAAMGTTPARYAASGSEPLAGVH